MNQSGRVPSHHPLTEYAWYSALLANEEDDSSAHSYNGDSPETLGLQGLPDPVIIPRAPRPSAIEPAGASAIIDESLPDPWLNERPSSQLQEPILSSLTDDSSSINREANHSSNVEAEEDAAVYENYPSRYIRTGGRHSRTGGRLASKPTFVTTLLAR